MKAVNDTTPDSATGHDAEVQDAAERYREALDQMREAHTRLQQMNDDAEGSGNYAEADDFRNYGYADTVESTLAARDSSSPARTPR